MRGKATQWFGSTPDEHANDGVIEFDLDAGVPDDAFLSLLTDVCTNFGVQQAGVHLTNTTVVKDYDRTWALGDYTPGVKTLLFSAHLPGKTRKDFAQYWITTHAPIVLEHHVGIWRYVQNVPVRPGRRNGGKTASPSTPTRTARNSSVASEGRRFDPAPGHHITAGRTPPGHPRSPARHAHQLRRPRYT
jgi:hypothetical protein